MLKLSNFVVVGSIFLSLNFAFARNYHGYSGHQRHRAVHHVPHHSFYGHPMNQWNVPFYPYRPMGYGGFGGGYGYGYGGGMYGYGYPGYGYAYPYPRQSYFRFSMTGGRGGGFGFGFGSSGYRY